MIRLKSLIIESICPFPGEESLVRKYLNSVIGNADTSIEVFKALNEARATWSDAEFDAALDYGACETWNIEVSTVLDSRGIMSQLYHGTPIDDSLPTHYYCRVGDTILDFVASQFWGYGLGRNINDADRVTYSVSEYSDILDAYNWNLL